MTLDSSNASIQSSIQLTTGTIPSNWFSVSDFQWKMWCSCRSLGNKFDLFLKNLFANYSVRTETKWRLLSIQLKIRDVPKWRNFLEKLLESPIIAEFPKCEPFNWKIPKFLVENWQMEIPVCVYLARFSLFLRNYCSIPRQIFGNSNQRFWSNGKRHKLVSAVYVNEHVGGCCQTRQISGGT